MKASQAASRVTPWALILTVILIIVKYVAAPSMSWWVVTSPLWFPWLVILAILLVVGIVLGVIALVSWILE